MAKVGDKCDLQWGLLRITGNRAIWGSAKRIIKEINDRFFRNYHVESFANTLQISGGHLTDHGFPSTRSWLSVYSDSYCCHMILQYAPPLCPPHPTGPQLTQKTQCACTTTYPPQHIASKWMAPFMPTRGSQSIGGRRMGVPEHLLTHAGKMQTNDTPPPPCQP